MPSHCIKPYLQQLQPPHTLVRAMCHKNTSYHNLHYKDIWTGQKGVNLRSWDVWI